MKFKKNGGFTLVELIVVIAILAILAGVAVPAYSGYIAKANEAADLQLLGSLNTAFGAACMENEINMADLSDNKSEFKLGADGKLTGLKLEGVESTLSVAVDTDKANAVWESFKTYYSGNLDTPFKVYVQIVFADGAFAGVTADENSVTITTSNGISVTISKDDAEKFIASVYGSDISSEELLGKIDNVTNIAADMLAGENSTLGNLFESPLYAQAFAKSLGIELDPEDPESVQAFVAAGEALALEKAKKDNPGVEIEVGDEKYMEAYNQIVANNAVLYAAQNSQAASENIMEILKGENSRGTISKNLVDAEKNGVGLSQAAIAYGLYTAYAERNGKEVPSNPVDVLTALDNDAEFKAYLNGENAAADLEGYMAAMNMINSNSNGDVVENVLINGFNSADLIELLNGAKK